MKVGRAFEAALRSLPTLFLAASLLAWSVPGHTFSGRFRLSWERCDPLTMAQEFVGPGTHTLVASVTDSTEPNNGHRAQVAVFEAAGHAMLPDAWRFDEGGCQDGGLTISHGAVAPDCPAFQGSRPLGIWFFGPGHRIGFVLDVANTYDTFTPDPSRRYTLWQARFDHAASVAGDSPDPQSCGGADRTICFFLFNTELLLADGTSFEFVPENDYAIWNDPGFGNCVVAVESSTWGRVKSHYR